MVVFGGTLDPTVNPFGASVPGSNDLWVWSTTLRQWSQPTPQFPGGNASAPNSQKFLSSVSLQSPGKMMALVGNSSTGTTQGDLLILDTIFWSWSIPTSPNPSSAPASRLGAAVGVSDHTVFIHGGAAVNANGYAVSGVLNDLVKLDDSTFEWTSIANGPALMYHTMCKLPGLNLMIIFGGSDTASNAFNTVHTFDLNREVWTLAVPVSPGIGGGIPSARKGHSAVCLNDTMVVFGGGTDGPLDDDVWVMNASTTQWVWNRISTNKQIGPGPRTGHSALLNGTNMLVWGGYGAPQANDINIYILDTKAWQWSSSKDIRAGVPVPAPAGAVGEPEQAKKSNLPVTIGVVCGSLALIAAFVGFLVLKRRATRRAYSHGGGQKKTKPGPDNASYLSDAEQYLSRKLSLDDKPSYYHHHSGRDSGSSLGGWPSSAGGRRNLSATPQEYPMRSMSTSGEQAATQADSATTDVAGAGAAGASAVAAGAVAGAAIAAANSNSPHPPSEEDTSRRTGQPQHVSPSIKRLSPLQQDADQISTRTGVRTASIASGPYYPAHLAEHDEEDADRWTFASSLSFDQREKAGPIPTLRYIPAAAGRGTGGGGGGGGSANAGLQRSIVQSTGGLGPSFSASRGPRRDASAPSILSRQASSMGGAPSIVLNAAAAGAGAAASQPLSREGSIGPRDTALFNSLSPLDRVSLMCSGMDVESQLSGVAGHGVAGEEEGGLTQLRPKASFPQWRDSYRRESFISATVDEEEEEEEKQHGAVSLSMMSSSSPHRVASGSTTYSFSGSGVPTTLDHPALATLIQNLPARYLVTKSPSPIHGPVNDILFAVDSDTQQPIVIKSFSRREAWERECRALRRLRGPCVVELKHVATLVLSETDDPNRPATIRLTILERLDETLAQMLKNARKAKKVALREQAAALARAQGTSAADREKELDLSGRGLYRNGTALNDSQIRDIVKGVLRCLSWCHSKRVVYCDLKPTNLMRNRDDPRQQWKLIDLEGSRTVEEEQTSGGGTVRYCPPEVAKAMVGLSDNAAVIQASATGVTAQYSMDLWAFGCLLYVSIRKMLCLSSCNELHSTRPLIPLSATTDAVLHFLANPSVNTPALPNGLRWLSSQELEIPYFNEAVQNQSARDLIRILLKPDPQQRANMDQVL
ncbi:F-box only protein 42, partial [Mortierella claussenii]